MRLFIAREALDPHLKVSGAVLNSKFPMGERLKAGLKAGLFYAGWYPKQWLPLEVFKIQVRSSMLKRHLRFASRMSRKLARSLFHAMVRNGPKLERQQLLLGRFVEIGTEIFAITASCLRAERLMETASETEAANVLQTVDYFCRNARLRIEEKFRAVHRNNDTLGYKLAQRVLAEKV